MIIEKPMAMCMQDAEKIINLSKKRGVKVAACHQNRFNIAVQKMREALESNRFGKLSHGSIHVSGIEIRIIIHKHLGVVPGNKMEEH